MAKIELVRKIEDELSVESMRSTGESLNLEIKKVLLTVPVMAPDKHQWIRTRPGAEWQYPTTLLKVEREFFYVKPELWQLFSKNEPAEYLMRMAIDIKADPFLWPIGVNSKSKWSATALQAAELAETRWIRVASNMSTSEYVVFEAIGDLGEPQWPDKTLDEIVQLAFRDRYISNAEHKVIRQLMGAGTK